MSCTTIIYSILFYRVPGGQMLSRTHLTGTDLPKISQSTEVTVWGENRRTNKLTQQFNDQSGINTKADRELKSMWPCSCSVNQSERSVLSPPAVTSNTVYSELIHKVHLGVRCTNVLEMFHVDSGLKTSGWPEISSVWLSEYHPITEVLINQWMYWYVSSALINLFNLDLIY